MKPIYLTLCFAVPILLLCVCPPAGAAEAVLRPDKLQDYVAQFNATDNDLYRQYIPNAKAAEFLAANVPLLDCPGLDIEKTYYFRWWTYRKHIKETRDGFVVTEFLPPVGWAGKHNTISCAVGHHLYEGRWLRDPKFLDDDSIFWLRKTNNLHHYSNWLADAIWARYCVNGNAALAKELLPDLVKNFRRWEKERRDANGLFWQEDGADGMEVAIGGTGYRATINSYMFGDARAIGAIAVMAGRPEMAEQFFLEADRIKGLVQYKLWDADAQFFKMRKRQPGQVHPSVPSPPLPQLADVCELYGYTPWYFNLPSVSTRYAAAWKQIIDPKGFAAPFGPTTAEQRHPKFAISYQGHECQWNGPSWPYSTAVTLTAMANLLNNYQQDVVTNGDYFNLLRTYTDSHRLKRDDGSVVPWIDENLNPLTGDWIARTRLKGWKNGTWDAGKGGVERGKDYNHSTYCDLIITGLIGLRPRADDTVEVNPLAPGDWAYFCLDNIAYHGRTLTILWDKTGQRYHRGQGLRVLADGREIAAADKLQRVTGKLPVN
ncbi:MAG: glycosyl hydrolase family 65 protein [Planctomycetota bacterium]